MKRPFTHLVSRTAGPLRTAAVRRFNLPFRKRERQMFFVFGHMRSGSTLLTNLLLAHPDIYGYGETHRVYEGPEDFGRAMLNIAWVLKKLPGDEPWAIDKLLHRRMTPQYEVMRNGRVLFLLREPAGALSSLVRMKQKQHKPRGASAYYTQRVTEMAEAAAVLDPAHWDFVTYHDLVHDTDAAFARVETLLGLTTPLREEYELGSHATITHVGDQSERIKAGRILRNVERDLAPGVEPFIPEAEARYRETLDALARLKGRPLSTE